MNPEAGPSGFALAFYCDSQRRLTAWIGSGLPWLDATLEIAQPIDSIWPDANRSAFEKALNAAFLGSESLIRIEYEGDQWTFEFRPALESEAAAAGILGQVRGPGYRSAGPDSIDSWPVCIFELDPEARIFNINQSGAQMLSTDGSDDLLNTRFVDLMDGRECERVDAIIQRGFGGQPSHFEFTDRAGRFFSCSLYPYRDPCGDEICCLFGIAHAAERRRVDESTMAESDQEYRLLVESAPFCIHQIDLDGKLVSMNEAGLRMMGVKEEKQVIGFEYLDAVATSDQEFVRGLLQQAFAGESTQFEFQTAEGKLFASSFVPIRDAEGQVLRLMGLTRDVTEERGAQDALLESEQRLELALKGANLGLWDWSVQSDQVVLDQGWANLLGYGLDELPPTIETMRRLVHPEDHEAQHLRLQAHLNGDTQSYESIHRMRAADGRWRWIVDRGMVTRRDDSGNALRITGTSAEITSEYEAENERRELEARLQQAQRMESIGHLAGGIAHDFNNVLTVISGNVDYALDEIESGRSPADCLEQIQRATERASELIGQLMTFSRRRPVSMTVVDLNSLSRDIFDMVSRVLPENIEFQFDSEPGLPMIEADPSQLEQIVLNLCMNARDAMPSGGALNLALNSETDDEGADWVALKVCDNGQGMDQEVLTKAFDPFFTTKHGSRGSGLGLAMVYGSVQQHGGRIALESEPGMGTQVTISFPACTGAEVRAAKRSVSSGKGEETVLVVEDEELVRDLAAKVLGRAGYRVLTAVDGQDGIEVFSRNSDQIQIVLLDVVMPRANGGEACRAMLDINPAVRVLFTSGYNQNNALPIELMREHDFPVMPKPYDNRTLLGEIRAMLDR